MNGLTTIRRHLDAPIKVLHVDDDADLRKFTKFFLEESDPSIIVESARSAEEALNLLKRPFDCVISDYKLGGTNGIELARKVKEISDIPFIIFTGHGSEEIASEAFSAGVDDYVRKEVDPSHYGVLAKRIRQDVERKRAKDLYKNVIEQSEDGIVILQGYEIKFANRKMLELSGYREREIVGKSFLSLFPKDLRADISEDYNKNLASETLQKNHEFEILMKRGEKLTIDINASYIDYEGSPSTLVFVRDVTSRIKYRKRLEILHDYAAKLSLTKNLKEIADLTLEAIKIVIGFTGAYFLLVDHSRLIQVSTIGAKIKDIEIPFEMEGITVRAVKEKRSILVRDTTKDPNYIPLRRVVPEEKIDEVKDVPETLSELAVPIIIDDDVIAVMNIESVDLNAFDSGDVKLMEILAMHVEHALMRSRMQDQLKGLEKKLALMHSYAIGLHDASRLAEVAERTLETVSGVLGFDQGSFGVVEEDKIHFILRKGLVSEGEFYVPLNGAGITVRAVKTGETQNIRDVRLDKGFILGPMNRAFSPISELAVPIKIGRQVKAIINVESQRESAFTRDDERLLETLAMHAASSIQRLGIKESENIQRARLETLHKHAVDLELADSLEEVVDLTLKAMKQSLGFKGAAFAMVEGEFLQFLRIEGNNGFDLLRLPLSGRGVTIKAVRTGESQLVHDSTKDDDFIQVHVEEGSRLSELAVPVKLEKKVVAVLDVEDNKAYAFSEKDRSLLETLAAHVGSALNRLGQIDKLQKSEEKYRRLLDSSLDAVLVIAGTRFVYANKRAADLFGVDDPSDLVGRDSLDFVAEKDVEPVKAKLLVRQKGGKTLNRYELKLKRKDGSLVDVETNATLIEYEGRPASLSINRDISDRIRLERRLKEHNEQLERLVEERTRDLLESERMGAAGKVASMVSHDLRTPLQTIKNSIYILRKKPESMDDSLTTIEKATDRAAQMLEDLRGRVGEVPIKFEKTSLRDLIESALAEHHIPQAVQVKSFIGDGLESVMLDPGKIRRVMDNLIRNALEAMPDGGSLQVKASKKSSKIVIEVSDTGCGIPEQLRAKLFKPFSSNKPKGTGLGLYYCKKAVEASGGVITFESAKGKGTTFRIELPIKTETQTPKPVDALMELKELELPDAN